MLRNLQGDRLAHDPGHVLGSGAPLPLLAAPGHLGDEGGASPDIEHACALGAAELVPGKAEKVDAEAVDVQGQCAGSLDGVRMDRDAPAQGPPAFGDGGRDLRHRLDRPDLVIGQHHRNQHRAFGYGAGDLAGVDETLGIDTDVGNVKAELLQVVAGVVHGMMFDRRRHDVVAGAGLPLGEGHTLQRGVDRLCPAAGEDDVGRPGVEHRCHGLAGIVDSAVGLPCQ